MKTIRDFINIVTEARRNPGINKTAPPIEQLAQYKHNADVLSNNVTNLFISMTAIDKLGINPTSTYHTPIGLYSYSVDYTLATVKKNLTDLPFVGDAPYINVFKASNPDKILILNRMSSDDLNYYSDMLQSMPEYAPHIPSSFFGASHPSPGGHFWYLTWRTALSVVSNTSRNAAVAWNTIFRKLGIDGCVDTGWGIIHPSEPSQAVFFTLPSIEVIDRIENKYNSSTSTQRIKEIINKFRAVTSANEYTMLKATMITHPEEMLYIPIQVMLKFNMRDALEMLKRKNISPKQVLPYVISKPEDAFEYAKIVLNGKKFPEGEPIIATSAEYSYRYASEILKHKPFPRGEPIIATKSNYSYFYALEIIKGEWPKGEPAIAKDAKNSIEYAKLIGKPFQLGEPNIARDAEYSYRYAKMLGMAFPLGEPNIALDPVIAYSYAKNVLGGKRFPLGEPKIARDDYHALQYALHIIRKPWPEGEAAIAETPTYAKQYDAAFGTNISQTI